MEAGKLNAEVRSSRGSSSNRKLRGGGKVPAVCYGAGEAPIALTIDPSELQKALDPVKGQNTLIHLNMGGKGVPVMLKDVQRDALRGNVTHVDFVRVRTDQAVRATVPIVITGKPEGVKSGGTLHQVYRTLTVQCTPDKIPARIEIEVSGLGLGQSIHVGDLKLEAGIQAAVPPTTTLCVVTAPKAEKAAEAAEGAEAAAEGAEAKAPAKAPAKGADAKAPAKGADAKAKAAPAKGK